MHFMIKVEGGRSADARGIRASDKPASAGIIPLGHAAATGKQTGGHGQKRKTGFS
jgi:hypothetical protein